MANTTSTHTLRFQTNTAELKRQLDAADAEFRQLAVQVDKTAMAMQKTSAQMASFGSTAGKVGKKTGDIGRVGGPFWMVSQQLQDIAIVSQFGDRALGQIGIQVGQLATAFGGLTGAAIGIAATFGGIFLQTIMNAEDELMDLDEALGNLTEAFNQMESWRFSDAYILDLEKVTTKYEELFQLMEQVTERQVRIASQSVIDASGLAAAVEQFQRMSRMAGQLGEIEFDFFGLDDVNEAITINNHLVRILRLRREDQAAALETLTGELDIRGLLTVEVQNLIASLITALGIQEQITEEVEKEAEARIRALPMNSSSPFAPLTDYFGVPSLPGDPENQPKKEKHGRKKLIDAETEAMRKFREETRKANEEFQRWRDSMDYADELLEYGLTAGIDGFIDAIADADTSMKDFARDFLRNIAKMIAQQALLNALSGMLGFGAAGASVGSIMRGISGIAVPQMPALAKGGVVTNEMSYRGATIGEAGPEAIMPLQRDAQGNLGVGAPNVNVYNYGGAQVSVEKRENEIAITIDKAVQAAKADFAQSMRTGQGGWARSMEQGYTARRRAT